jgi:hypothetical protein
MTLLPIVSLELRKASKRPMTYWGRFSMALIAVFFAAYAMFLFQYVPMFGRSSSWLFSLMVYGGAWYCVLAGLRHSCDCVSREKREGTLGLLFLTDLKGYDVALGKLASSSLVVFFTYMAVFPIMAMSLMMGGVSGGQFWKSVLALMNLLFISHATGLMTSTYSTKAQQSFGRAGGLLFFLIVLTPLLSQWAASYQYITLARVLEFINPVGPISGSSPRPARYDDYWLALAGSHLLGWCFLAIAAWNLPRCWQDRAGKQRLKWRERFRQWTYGGTAVRERWRRVRLSKNPFYWFVSRSRTTPFFIWGFLVVVLAFYIWMRVKWITQGEGLSMSTFSGFLMVDIVLISWVSSESESHLNQARRDGSLEMLFSCTPLKESEVILGQWLGLKRLFLWPMVTVILAQMAQIIELYVRFSEEKPNLASLVLLGIFLGFLASVPWISMWHGFAGDKPGQGTRTVFLMLVLLPLICSLFFVVSGYFLAAYLSFTFVFCLFFAIHGYAQLKSKMRLLASPPLEEPLGFFGKLGRWLGRLFRDTVALKSS